MLLTDKKCLVAFIAALSSSTWGQQLPNQDTALGNKGVTKLQKNTGNAVQSTCAALIPVSSGLVGQQARLFDSCRKMVQTATDGAHSLGLSDAELAAGLQQVATEEFANTESVANEIATNRNDPVITRLEAVRSGIGGFTAQGFDPEDNELVADREWLDAMGAMRGGSAGDDAPGSAWSGFLNIGYGTGSRDKTTWYNAFDYDSYNVTLGADYRFSGKFVLGVALNYHKVDSAFDEAPTVAGGDLDTEGLGGTLYGTYYGKRFYIDGILGYTVSDYDIQRNVVVPSKTAETALIGQGKGNTSSSDYTASVGAGGYFGRGAFGWGPYARLTYSQVDIDGYQEKGLENLGFNLNVRKQDWTSLISALGAQFSYTFSQSYGVIAPNMRLGWLHQFENDARQYVATYAVDPNQFALIATTDEPDRDYGELGLGITSVFKGGGQVFFNYDTLLDLEHLTSHLFTLGGRLEF